MGLGKGLYGARAKFGYVGGVVRFAMKTAVFVKIGSRRGATHHMLIIEGDRLFVECGGGDW